MRTAGIVALGAVAVIAIASQLVLPGLAEDAIEDRLTERGGEADASVSAFPAALLLAGDGDEIAVTGSGFDLDLAPDDPEVFESLDGFDRVDVSLADFRAGPFQVESFELLRDGDGPYALVSESSTTGSDLLDYGADRLGLLGGSLLRFFGGDVPGVDRPIPISLDMQMESDDGRVRVVAGGGTVAGYPTGPLAELITAAIVVRL